MVRVAAVSLRSGLGRRRIAAVKDVLRQCAEAAPAQRLVLLPGVDDDAPVGNNWSTSIAQLATEFGVAVLHEAYSSQGRSVRRIFQGYDPAAGGDVLSVEQAFSDSGEADRQPELVDEVLRRSRPGGGGRSVMAGCEVGLLVCGENNVLRNAQADANRVSIRHQPDMTLFDDVDIVCNGAHTIMGNWGKLDRRFEYLSASCCMLYATNNNTTHWTRACRAYVDGQLVATGAGARGSFRRNGHEVGIEILDSSDDYRAIFVDLPLGK